MELKNINDLVEFWENESNCKSDFGVLSKQNECLFILLEEIYRALRGSAKFRREYKSILNGGGRKG